MYALTNNDIIKTVNGKTFKMVRDGQFSAVWEEVKTALDVVTINTVKGIKDDVSLAKRSLKAIAAECLVFSAQSDDASKSVYLKLANCRTRRQFYAVFAEVL